MLVRFLVKGRFAFANPLHTTGFHLIDRGMERNLPALKGLGLSADPPRTRLRGEFGFCLPPASLARSRPDAGRDGPLF